MKEPFAAFDVDGTIFKSSLAEKVVERCIADGLFPADAFNEVHANRRRWQANNNEGLYQAYMRRLVGAFVEQMAGVDVEQFVSVTDSMIEEHQVRMFAFPRRLMRELRSSHHIVAISGSPDILVKPFLRLLPVHGVYGSTYHQSDGRFTGAAESVGDKAAILKGLVATNVARREDSVAIGDTMGDIPMLEYAEHAVMFNASRTLTCYGSEFGWRRVNEVKDLVTALQYQPEAGLYVETDPDEIIRTVQPGR